MWHRSLVSGMHRMRLWPTHVLNDSSEFHLASQETAGVVHRVPSSIPPTESAAPGELCNMGFVLPQCYETSVKHLRTERIKHASYKSCSALTWRKSLGHATWGVWSVVLLPLSFSISFHNKQERRMQGLRKFCPTWTSTHLYLCITAFHQQIQTNMCCLARLQIHDDATISKSGGTITTVWAHLHSRWILQSWSIWAITQHWKRITLLTMRISMIPRNRKPLGFLQQPTKSFNQNTVRSWMLHSNPALDVDCFWL